MPKGEVAYKHGDEVAIALKGAAYLGRVEERFISKSPEKRTALFVCIPLHFPYRLETLKGYGAEIYLVKGAADGTGASC